MTLTYLQRGKRVSCFARNSVTVGSNDEVLSASQLIDVHVSCDLCSDCCVRNIEFIIANEAYDIFVGIILAVNDSCDELI